MACTITIDSAVGTVIGATLGQIVLTGTASNCSQVRVIYYCDDAASSEAANVPVLNGSWTATFTSTFVVSTCQCSGTITVIASCSDGNETCITSKTLQIECLPQDCCDLIVWATVSTICQKGQHEVTLNALNNCPTNIGAQWDFGDGQTGTPFSISPGPPPRSEPHLYGQGTYTATLHIPGCPDKTYTFVVPACADCCPKIDDVKVDFGECNDKCERFVKLITSFSPPAAGCSDAVLEWHITGQNNFSDNGSAFTTGASSPHTSVFWLNPDNSPYEATLVIISPSNCPEIVNKAFTVPPCKSEPDCPKISNFKYELGDCVKVGDECCKMVEFSYDANVNVGCGNTQKPIIRIYFGDGDFADTTFNNSGTYSETRTHNFCKPGTYNAELEIIYPQGCSKTPLQVNVPACDPKECEEIPPPDLCPCCILLGIIVILYYLLWALGTYAGDLQILGVNLGPPLGWASLLFGLLIYLLIRFCYKRVTSCKKCWECRLFRCMFYTLIAAIILILILFVISLFTGVQIVMYPYWVQAVLAAAGAALIFWGLMQSDKCQVFYNTGKCKE